MAVCNAGVLLGRLGDHLADSFWRIGKFDRAIHLLSQTPLDQA